MTTLVLCAGYGERFRGSLKQEVVVDGLPLLDRTIGQFARWSEDFCVVTDKVGLCVNRQMRLEPEDRCCTCASLLSARSRWSETDRTAVLLGDVYFTDHAVSMIMEVKPEGVAFFTDTQDIFAVVFEARVNGEVEVMLRQLIARARDTNDPGLGKMWDWFRAFHGMTERNNEEMKTLSNVAMNHTWIPIGDRTQDFDTQEQYQAFMAKRWKNAFIKGTARMIV